MKIVIVNQHSCNRGDEAAGRAVIESLLNAFPNSTIEILYHFFGEYPAIANDTNRVTHFPQYKYVYDKKCIYKLYLEIGWNFLLGLLRFKKGFIGSSGNIYKKIANADIVVNAPTGPNIGDIYRNKFYMLNLLFAEICGKKTFMYGSSVGPFNIPWVRDTAKFIFEKMNVVCVREDVSLEHLNKLKLKNKNIYSSLDAAIQRDINAENADVYYKDAGFNLNTYNVGITPLAFPWYPKEIRDEEHQQIVEKNLTTIIDKITENGDTNVFFFPQLYSTKKDGEIGVNDMPIIKSIISKVKQPEFCKIIPIEYDSDIQQIMISKLNYFIGMRYHSLIFSIKMGVPVVAICYEHKATGFLEKVNLKELIVKLEDFCKTPNIVFEKIDYINQNSETLKNSINKHLPELKKLSSKGTMLIKKYLEK